MRFIRRQRQAEKSDPPVPPEIASMLALVEPMEKAVLVARFGLDRGEPRTFEEAASFLGWPVDEVEQLERSAVERLRAARGAPAEEDEAD